MIQPAHSLQIAAILSPFVVLPLAGWLGGRGSRAASLLSSIPALLTAYFLLAFRSIGASGAETTGMPWITSLGLSLTFHLDGLGLLFAVLITGVGTLIVLYAAPYFDGHPQAGRFHATLFAFMGSMLGLVLSDNLFLLFVFWELTGFTSYLLIGFEHERAQARRAALQALLVTGAGGLALLAAAVVVWQATGTASLSVLLAGGPGLLTGHRLHGPLVALVLLAAFTKSAQFPFHFWLPNAMEAPTPVSAYLHSATMVKAGVYLVARMTPVLGGTPLWAGALILVGALTMMGGACRAILETDLKRVLAYSTISALGVLMLALGIGTPAAILACLAYLLAHACYKGALFLVAGGVEHETGTRDATALGGLRGPMPKTAAAAMLAAASMAGIPLFFGFVAKEQLYGSIPHGGPWPTALLVATVVSSALLGAAGLIAGVSPFFGRASSGPAAREPAAWLWLSPLALAVLGLIAGVLPAIVGPPLALAAGAVMGRPVPVTLAVWHGLTGTLLLSALTLAGALAVFASRASIRRYAWPRSLHAEGLYTFALSALDALSRTVGPPLQGASLRSYVLTIVLAATGLVATVTAVGGVMPPLNRWTAVRVHEAMVAALVVGAALSAAGARSTMAAVLSLGAVGYGVGLIYVLFGAPDLAMTQFAVETLTVVIFVLVFRHLRGFGDLSGKLVKARDALIAAVVGTLIGALVFFIGTSGTTSRLAAYFAENAPTRGHGLNVVNVILVDFRAFDTLGEITVLATVAIGVKALLRMGRRT
jgi:multicomponent Na+:H+ antiporter subunit A